MYHEVVIYCPCRHLIFCIICLALKMILKIMHHWEGVCPSGAFVPIKKEKFAYLLIRVFVCSTIFSAHRPNSSLTPIRLTRTGFFWAKTLQTALPRPPIILCSSTVTIFPQHYFVHIQLLRKQ